MADIRSRKYLIKFTTARYACFVCARSSVRPKTESNYLGLSVRPATSLFPEKNGNRHVDGSLYRYRKKKKEKETGRGRVKKKRVAPRLGPYQTCTLESFVNTFSICVRRRVRGQLARAREDRTFRTN